MILLKKENKNDIKTVEGQNAQIEGANITDFELKGDTYQKSYTGKNKLNLINSGSHNVNGVVNNDGTVTISGKANATSGDKVFESSQTLYAGTYTMTLSKELPFLVNFTIASGVGFRIPAGQKSATVTLNNDYTTGALFMAMTNDTTYNETFKIQIVSGSTPDYDFEPYVGGVPSPNPDYPQEIVSVTGLQNAGVCGKNVYNTITYNDNFNQTTYKDFSNILEIKNNYSSISRTIETNTNYFKTTMTNTYDISQTWHFKNLLPNTQYTISCNVDINKSDGTVWLFESAKSPDTTSLTRNFTTNSSGEYSFTPMFYMQGTKTIGDYVELSNIQLEVGSTATSYEPYKGNDYEVNLGKNLATDNFNDSTNGTPLYKTIESGTQIYISSNVSSSIDRLYAYLDNTFVGNIYISYSNGKITYSGSNSFKFNKLRCPSGITCTESLLSLGQATSYSPYFPPYELNKIVDYEDSIKKSTGKNLFDISTVYSNRNGYNLNVGVDVRTQEEQTNGSYSINGSNLSMTFNASWDYTIQYLVPVNANTNYCLSCPTNQTNLRTSFYELDSEYKVLTKKVEQGKLPVGSITTTSNTKYLLLSITANTTGTITILNIQLEEGSQANEYEPYGKVWYVEKQTNKVVLNGTEEWTAISMINNYGYYTYLTNILSPSSASELPKSLCNRFISKAPNNQWLSPAGDNNYTIINTSNPNTAVRFSVGDNTNKLSDFKAWLNTNNIEIIYVLYTPIYEVITNEELINQLEKIRKAKLLNGENNIMINASDLVGTFKISYDDWYKFEKILRSGYNIKEDYDRITQKFINGRRKQILSDYKDCIIQLSLGTFDLETTVEYLKQLEDGEYEYYSFDDHEYKRANFLLEEKPEIIVANSLKEDEAEVEDFDITLLKAGE